MMDELIDKTADAGGSQLIIDGKVKLKNDSQIECFTASETELPADVVFAAG
jgi:hypothetical protein